MEINNIQKTKNTQPVFSAAKVVKQAVNTVKDINNSTNYENELQVIAHRGYSSQAPENTIPAFTAAAQNGYDTIEIDIQWTKDNIPVILHDDTINRTARTENGGRLFFPRKCSWMNYNDLLKYDFGSYKGEEFEGTKIPTFDETLQCANDNNLNLYVELKDGTKLTKERAEILTNMVKEAGLEDKITWISFDSDYLNTIKELLPNARLGLLYDKKVTDKTIKKLESLKTDTNEVFLDVKSSKMNDKADELLDNAGFEFEAWTIDSLDTYKKIEKYGCSGITTNAITEDDLEEYYGE